MPWKGLALWEQEYSWTLASVFQGVPKGKSIAFCLLAVPLTLQLRQLLREAAVALLQSLVLLIQRVVAIPQLLQFFYRVQAERDETLEGPGKGTDDQPPVFLPRIPRSED